MITIKSYSPNGKEATGGPFGMKVICMANLLGIPYELEILNDPRKMPKGKLPVIVDAGETIADSEVIRRHLEAKAGLSLDDGLTDEQKAVSRAVIRMVDENLYFAGMTERWGNDGSWDVLKASDAFGDMPKILKPMIANSIRKGVIKQCNMQGFGRHEPEERMLRIKEDIDALAGIMGDKPFLFGDNPTAADCSAVPMLRSMATIPAATDYKDVVYGNAPIAAYVERGAEAMYGA